MGEEQVDKAKADKGKNLRKDLPIVAHEFSFEELQTEYGVSFQTGLTSALGEWENVMLCMRVVEVLCYVCIMLRGAEWVCVRCGCQCRRGGLH